MRRLAACAVAVTVVAVTPATAAPKPKPKPKPCPTVSDDRGDQAPFPDSLDVVSGDVVFGPSTVYAVLRLAGPPAVGAPHGAGGATWQVGVTANGVRITFQVRDRGPLGTTVAAQAGHTSVPVTYARDLTKSEIRWAAPRARVLPGRATLRITDAAAMTQAYGLTADTATARRTC